MQAQIKPNLIDGKLHSIASKSYAHRILILASLSNKPCKVLMSTDLCDDIKATINCLEALGANFEFDNDYIYVTPIKTPNQNVTLNCLESGSTLRFLIPVVASLGCNATFVGTGNLPSRPIDTALNELKKHGIKFSSYSLPFTMSGKLENTSFEVDGNISSQFITGFLLALFSLGSGNIKAASPIKSKSYVDITIEMLKKFGADIILNNNEYTINQTLNFKELEMIEVDGDWSNSAFFLCAGAISNELTISGLDINSSQGDKKIIDILKDYGANIEVKNTCVTVSPKFRNPMKIDATDIPDLVPIISVLLSVANGTSTIFNVERLKYKESDRIKSTIDLINSLGGNAKYEDNKIVIEGKSTLNGGTVNGYNDHRIVMSGAIASCVCKNNVIISDANSVNKSYPNFFEDFNSLGGNAHVF